jgi:hypothetical protein
MNTDRQNPVRPAPLREVLDADGIPEQILGQRDFELLWTTS